MPPSLPTFCGAPLSGAELELIQACVARFRHLSRTELAATVCEWLGWERPNGRLKTRECRDLLQALEALELLELPALRAGRPRGAATTLPRSAHGEAKAPVSAPLRSLQPIGLIRVEQPAEHALWRELMGRHHYLGHRTAYGASLRYLIAASAGRERILGAVQFSSPAWRMRARDAWIGWNEATRKRNLPRLINNSRFLILPWVRVPHLASHVLALALRRVLADWEACYGLRPWLSETLVDPQRFSGVCYRAANWIDVGLTTGRGRQDRHHSRHNAAPKRIFLYPLRAHAQQALASAP
ncbi:MAG: DUF4338 domain-containing protein [Nitrococcus sp.]|nr:DUF4338 domain-containing protein [Nitrococcus sp.]